MRKTKARKNFKKVEKIAVGSKQNRPVL